MLVLGLSTAGVAASLDAPFLASPATATESATAPLAARRRSQDSMRRGCPPRHSSMARETPWLRPRRWPASCAGVLPRSDWVPTHPGEPEPGTLDGTERGLDSVLAGTVAAALSWVPFDITTTCPLIGDSSVPSLIGLRSSDGTTTWVRTGGHCRSASNGVFLTSVDLRMMVGGLMEDGALPVLPSGHSIPAELGRGRPGQSTELIRPRDTDERDDLRSAGHRPGDRPADALHPGRRAPPTGPGAGLRQPPGPGGHVARADLPGPFPLRHRAGRLGQRGGGLHPPVSLPAPALGPHLALEELLAQAVGG